MPIWMGVKVGYARDAVLAEVAGLIDNWAKQDAVGGEGPGASPTATGSGLVVEGPDAEADAAGYGGAVEERPLSKAKVKENARVVAATATSKAPPARGQGQPRVWLKTIRRRSAMPLKRDVL